MITRYAFRLLLMACMLCVVFAPYHEWAANYIGAFVHAAFEQSGMCKMVVKKTSCTLRSPSITFHDVRVVDASAAPLWSWTAQRYTIAFSWLHLMLYGMIDMHIEFEGLQAHSVIKNGQCAIVWHILNLMRSGEYVIPTFIASLIASDMKVSLSGDEGSGELNIEAQAHRTGTCVDIRLNLEKSCLQPRVGPPILLHEGHMTVSMPSTSGLASSVCAGTACVTLPGIEEPFQIDASWEQQTGRVLVQASRSQAWLLCDTIAYDGTQWALRYDTRLPSKWLMPSLDAYFPSHGTLDAHGSLHTNGSVHIFDEVSCHMYTDSSWYGLPCEYTYNGTALCSDRLWQTTGIVSTMQRALATGVLSWDRKSGRVTYSGKGLDALSIPFLKSREVRGKSCDFQLSLDMAEQKVAGSCTALIHNKETQADEVCTLNLQACNGRARCTLTHPALAIECAGLYYPKMLLTRFLVTDVAGHTVAKGCARGTSSDRFKFQLAASLMRAIGTHIFGHEIQGDGVFTADLTLSVAPNIKFVLRDGSIHLPGIYNFVRSMDVACTIDFAHKEVVCEQGTIGLDRGTILLDGFRAGWSRDGYLDFMYAPVNLQKDMIMIDRGIFAFVSGMLLVQWQRKNQISVDGHVFIDQAYMEGNIFSYMMQQAVAKSARDLFMYNYIDSCVCNITCESVKPVKVKTAFLETQANVDLHIVGSPRDPMVTGTIMLQGGSFFFPYKPLYVTHGVIHFDGKQPHDSLLELVASGKVKKHFITLQVTGSLQNNAVNLFSSPSLSYEQILSLLLVGSQEESLNIVMPALVMQNLTGLLFSYSQSSVELSSFFGKILRPFEHIRFVPSFADQSGRGGLRGALEVEITSRLRAMVQKNFSLLEDTRFEVEYTVSDDIVLRGMRNERRDIGGEVEVRWKF